MRVVTGATGFVGNALVRGVLADGASDVRALVGPSRRAEALADLDVELVGADVRDPDSLLKAFRGAEVVYHTAGVVSISTWGYERLRAVNVEGTRNVIAACRQAGVRRLVHTSSVHALVEPPRGTCLDETFAADPARVRGPYAKTKAEATQLVLAAAREGLEAVVVFPSGIIGPHDLRPSDLGQFVLSCSRGRLWAYVDGAYNFVDVRDVARGSIAAGERGRAGEGYVLAGHEVSVAELLELIARVSGAQGPRCHLPFALAQAVGPIMPAYYRARRQRALFTSYSLHVIKSNCYMSSGKAAHELGFNPRPIVETITDTVGWFRQAGML